MHRFQAHCVRKVSSNTGVLLPKTDFPLKVAPKMRKERDIWIMKEASFDGLYGWQREAGNLREEFILHDGPPYANGKTHMGHALNKILKDFTTRYQLLSGKKVHYIPGWDCHGLPIEIKALEAGSSSLGKGDSVEIRKRAESFARATIEDQKSSFIRWGVMADWENHCYYSFTPSYIASQLKIFFSLYEKGLVYRDYKPVYWSPSSRTALAESELEYNLKHVSPSVYLKLRLDHPLPDCFGTLPADTSVSVVIWTTTPWTLPANQAVCFSPEKEYCLVKSSAHSDQYLVIACELKSSLEQLWGTTLQVIQQFPGAALNGGRYVHPMRIGEALPLLPADHVTMVKGTGFVHTAPAHGPEDFLVALQHKIPTLNLVDEEGKYNDQASCGLSGLSVLGVGQKTVLDLLQGDIIHRERFVHSYPYDWRTKQPVILRASLQWFIDTDIIKDRALEAMKEVSVVPPNLEKPMLTQLAKRPYWCISRQRSWGVPIPVFFRNGDNEAIVHKDIIERLCHSTLERRGIDHWWTSSPDELIGDDLMKRLGLTAGQVTRGQDIMDIWFDSGVSWNNVLPKNKQADLYLEGIDQFGGWFQSSLLTCVAATGRAPYKKLYVHGFALDSQGRKMSKSLGNVIDPQVIIDGDGKKQEAFGVDVLRWWTASHITGNGSGVPVSTPLIRQTAEDVHKIRSVLRFLLGNLHGVSRSQIERLQPNQMDLTDRYALHLLSECVANALVAYGEMNYKKVASLLTHFISNYVSSFYCHIVKDRLYCLRVEDEKRTAAVYVLSEILDQLTLVLAPILPHLAEEVEIHHPWHSGKGGLFRNRSFGDIRSFHSPDVVAWMSPALAVRDSVNKIIANQNSKIWNVDIRANALDFELLQKLQEKESAVDSALCELLQVSTVNLAAAGSSSGCEIAGQPDPQVSEGDAKTADIHHQGGIRITLTKTPLLQCPRCRRFTSTDGQLCLSCSTCLMIPYRNAFPPRDKMRSLVPSTLLLCIVRRH